MPVGFLQLPALVGKSSSSSSKSSNKYQQLNTQIINNSAALNKLFKDYVFFCLWEINSSCIS